MQKIIISGCSGHMGRVVESLCAADPQVQVAAGFDILGSSDRDFPVFSSPAQFSGEADAVIDFSSPAALEGLLDFARATGTPLVLATTGYTPEQVAQIGAAALEVPIFRSANMSLVKRRPLCWGTAMTSRSWSAITAGRWTLPAALP